KFVQKFNVTKIVLVDKIIEKRPVIVLASGDGLRGSYGQCSGRKMPPLPCGHSKLKSVPQRLRAKFRKQFGEQRLRIRISVTRQKEVTFDFLEPLLRQLDVALHKQQAHIWVI